MYTEILRYQLAEGQEKDSFLETCNKVHDTWMQHQPGFVGWKINHVENNQYVDFVIWKDAASAQAAQPKMAEIEESLSAAWQGCYDMSSVTAERVSEVKSF